MRFSLRIVFPLGALLLAGCSGARWGEEAGAGGGQMGNALTMNSGENMATGGVSASLASATVQVIAIGEADAQDRAMAKQFAETLLKIYRSPTGRYLAVPSQGKYVMLYDTKKRTLGSETYELRSLPANSCTITIAGHRALYLTVPTNGSAA